MKYHYIVTESTPGYMPESDPVGFNSKTRAEDYARSIAKRASEEFSNISGNPKDGYRMYHSGGSRFGRNMPPDEHDLGRIIEVYYWKCTMKENGNCEWCGNCTEEDQ